ncbi:MULTISPECIES: HAMP domain-containing methyl-accepting chemotaxis protein [Stutzerimonas]|jgi:methyl-accepting chemotaxis protein|uniref:HAMP domain-containing methyl-accepting chemotaxis protein n=1 Tax=Stutzerimonas TaxID=2901164 RepID=UPI000774E36E|nr:methyl-accepting chemotaxis protein [Stutzerimonas balearica]MBK3748469.1 HAMP domain-containing protein [Stutzerimonas balearica]MBK3826666.1 HAMP domain-containing protein [Stutzerimonas balearica]MBK3856356.1 HAMP domain-containing protein [Stutzerimonas balearica]MCZ4127222.1 methyl-accepting chemotaxis protein [Stutzerimonas balearica]OMG65542.1 methyl-accepting chemotaxis protein [Stutzerimonas balearica]
MHVATNPFTNLPVGRKLAIGFGTVLALTLAVTATGFYAVEATVAGSQRINKLAGINAGILDARGDERDFALTREERAAAELRSGLASIDSELDALGASSNEAEQAGLTRIRQAVDAYAAQFDEYRELINRGQQLRAQMGETAQRSREEFEFIELDMYDAVRALRLEGDRLKGSDPLTIAEATSGLTKQVLDMRTLENAFVASSDQQSVTDWQAKYSDVSSIGSNLKIWLDDEQKSSMDAALAALEQYRAAFDEFRQNRSNRLAAERRMAELSGEVIAAAGQTLELATETMRSQRSNVYLLLALIGGLAIVIGALAALTITRMIVGPLRDTVAQAERVAAGDLSHSQASARRDEVGQLQNAMHRMNESLRNLIGRIGGGVSQIAAAAEQLSAVTAQTSAGVQTQREETDQVATAMNEMAATVQEVARNAEQASLAARQADQQARQGDRVVRDAIGQIGTLSSEVEHSAQAIEALNEQSGRIGSVLEVIRAVAEQTNLLALNAAIEAARAGEQGRGFAVVADEVRALARRTHDSTEEIEGLIGSLQQVAGQAVEQMQTSRDLTQRTVALANEAGTALGRITDSVSTIEQMNQQIAAAAEQQSSVAENISESVTRVRDIGEQSASGSEQTASASAELARLGIELQELVRQFRT